MGQLRTSLCNAAVLVGGNFTRSAKKTSARPGKVSGTNKEPLILLGFFYSPPLELLRHVD